MTTDLKTLEDNKNPLSLALGVAVMWAILYMIRFIDPAHREGLIELGNKQLDDIVAILLSVWFIIEYCRKSMLAWWIAVLYIPIDWALELVFDIYSLDWRYPVVTGIGWFLIILPYFRRRYKPYKQFIEKQIAQDRQ